MLVVRSLFVISVCYLRFLSVFLSPFICLVVISIFLFSWTPFILSGLLPVFVSRFCMSCVLFWASPSQCLLFCLLFIFFVSCFLSVFRTSWLLILVLCSRRLRPCLLILYLVSSDYLCFDLCLLTTILVLPFIKSPFSPHCASGSPLPFTLPYYT